MGGPNTTHSTLHNGFDIKLHTEICTMEVTLNCTMQCAQCTPWRLVVSSIEDFRVAATMSAVGWSEVIPPASGRTGLENTPNQAQPGHSSRVGFHLARIKPISTSPPRNEVALRIRMNQADIKCADARTAS